MVAAYSLLTTLTLLALSLGTPSAALPTGDPAASGSPIAESPLQDVKEGMSWRIEGWKRAAAEKRQEGGVQEDESDRGHGWKRDAKKRFEEVQEDETSHIPGWKRDENPVEELLESLVGDGAEPSSSSSPIADTSEDMSFRMAEWKRDENPAEELLEPLLGEGAESSSAPVAEVSDDISWIHPWKRDPALSSYVAFWLEGFCREWFRLGANLFYVPLPFTGRSAMQGLSRD